MKNPSESIDAFFEPINPAPYIACPPHVLNE